MGNAQMPQYKCHKVVQAAKIVGIEQARSTPSEHANDAQAFHAARLQLEFSSLTGGSVHVDEAWMEKHRPQAGGYYVLYDDGYASYSPAKAFEEGYTRLPPLGTASGSVGAASDAIEAEIRAKGLTAPRVTSADIEAAITDVEIVKHITPSGQVLRWAVFTMRNGYAVVGKPSCAVSSQNDDADIGVAVATANTRAEVWPLMGYALKERLAAGAGTGPA
jgi:hypothetical protein